MEASGAFSSPPGNVIPDNDDSESLLLNPIHCQWRIAAAYGERILLNVSALDIPESPNCESDDYLEIRDGYFLKAPLIGRFCGQKNKPEIFVSNGNRIWIEYRRSADANKISKIEYEKKQIFKGFAASYKGKIQLKFKKFILLFENFGNFFENFSVVCGGNFSADTGIIQSPNFPHEYRSDSMCIWRISVPENYQVALIFQSFEVFFSFFSQFFLNFLKFFLNFFEFKK